MGPKAVMPMPSRGFEGRSRRRARHARAATGVTSSTTSTAGTLVTRREKVDSRPGPFPSFPHMSVPRYTDPSGIVRVKSGGSPPEGSRDTEGGRGRRSTKEETQEARDLNVEPTTRVAGRDVDERDDSRRSTPTSTRDRREPRGLIGTVRLQSVSIGK